MPVITEIPKGLTWNPNCEVYFNGEYLGRVQPQPKFIFQEVIDEFLVWAPGDRAEGVADTQEMGMMILYVNWLATSKRLEGEAIA